MKDGKRHHNFRDLTGLRFGMLQVIGPSHTDGAKWHWLSRCDCGNIDTYIGGRLTQEVKRGGIPNCGCATSRLLSEGNRRHGMSKHPAYAVWRSMLSRCHLPSHRAWGNYGGRGITVCARWKEGFENFWEDMGPTYLRGLELDRIDNNEGYTPENCRWATRRSNAMNKRGTIRAVDVPTLAAETGISRSTLYYRIRHGWTVEELHRTPSPLNRCGTS